MSDLVSLKFKNKLKSSMKEHLISFLERKRLAGSPYQKESVLVHFDNMLAEHFPNTNSLTNEICNKWIEVISKNNVSNNTIIRRLTPIRQFALYLNSIDILSIVPDIPVHSVKYECHLITEQELIAFFKSADRLPYRTLFPLRHITAPVMFRLMFSTGMRSNEVRNLETSDVNLKNGKVFIRESKSHQLRIIIVSDDMLKVLNHYDALMQQNVPNRKMFFSFWGDGKMVSKSCLNATFHIIWDHLPEAASSKAPKMTIRDFRHCFALNCIYQWYKQGRNVNAIEDYLVCYMGHSNFEQTSYYIHLAEMVYPELRNSIHHINDGILPDISSVVDNEEVPYDA